MPLRIRRFTVVTALIVLVLAGGLALAQTVLTQLGQTEASAREYILWELGANGGTGQSGLLVAAYQVYDKLSPAARTAATAWLKETEPR
jgi:hypothetical protein